MNSINHDYSHDIRTTHILLEMGLRQISKIKLYY